MSEFVSRKFVATFEDIAVTEGKEYTTFMNDRGHEVYLDDEGQEGRIEYQLSANAFFEEISEPETQALQIEEGKSYITRDGRKVGPIRKGEHDEWPFDLDHFKQEDLPDDLACTLWNKHGKSVDEENLDLISEYKEPEIKVGDLYTFVGEENGNGCYTKGKTYKVVKLFPDDQFQMTDNFDDKHWWDKDSVEEFFIPGSFGDLSKPSPIQTTTVKQIISGDYGRLRIASDGYHSLNLSIIDGKSRCVSVDEMREMVRVLEEIILARES